MGISLNPASLLSGQGFDVPTLVDQLLSQKSGQLTEWQNEQSTLQNQAGLLTNINSDLTNLASAVTALSDPLGALTGLAATSSDTSILNATAQSSATSGTHQIVVTNLATAGTTYTGALADGNTSFLPTGVTTGDIQLQVGGSTGTTRDIPITAGSNDTLNTLASYINQQGWGVSASVVTDATGARLALFSQATGSAGALAINSNSTPLTFSTPSGGTNASLTVDGVPFSSASNTITGAIPGVTLNLTGASPGVPVQLTVGPDTTQATQAINTFVAAYNQIVGDINQQYALDPTTNTEGPLGADSSLRQLQSSLLADVTYSPSGSGSYTNLAALGINMNNDGTLTVDSAQLSSALSSNPSAFLNFFQNSTSTGFADAFHKDLTNLTDPTQGLLNVDLTQNQAEQTDLSNSINNFQTQLTTEQQSLTQEFSQVDASLQSYPLLLQQVTETLATLDSSGSTTSSSSSPTLTSGL
jgi:flagellar hook-associated protein 2